MMLRVSLGKDAQMFDQNLKADHDTIITKMKKHWNKLPLEIRKCSDVSKFKKALKAHLTSTSIKKTLTSHNNTQGQILL